MGLQFKLMRIKASKNKSDGSRRDGWLLLGKEWVLLLAGWQILGLGAALLFSFTRQNFHAFTYYLSLILVFTNLAALAFSLLMVLDAAFFEKWLKKRIFKIAANITIISAIILFTKQVAPRIVNMVCPMGIPHDVDKGHIAFALANLAVIVISVLASVLVYMQARLRNELERKIGENERLKRLQVETKFAALQSKVNPHFLFNTLNTVVDLVYKQPAQVEEIILNLSGIYRKVLAHPDHELTSLKEEIELVKNYLQVEKARMGNRLRFDVDVDDSLQSWQIPQMALQILVENAILHGLSKKKEGGHIRITAKPRGDTLRLTVRDDGAGLNGLHTGNGMALGNLCERLQLLYKEGAEFHLKEISETTGGAEAILEIPRARHS